MKIVEYSFKDGTTIKGTMEDIINFARIKGEPINFLGDYAPEGYYNSESKGLIKISEMNPVHIKNALNKVAFTYFKELGKAPLSNKQYCRKFTELATLPKVQELFEALYNSTE